MLHVLVFSTRCFTVPLENYVLYADIGRCDWNVIFISSSSQFRNDLLIPQHFCSKHKVSGGFTFRHRSRPRLLPHQGHDGYCSSLRETTKPVWLAAFHFCGPFSEHISAVHFGLSTKIRFVLFFWVFFGGGWWFFSNSGWCCLQGHSGSFCFPQHWTLTRGRTNLSCESRCAKSGRIHAKCHESLAWRGVSTAIACER